MRTISIPALVAVVVNLLANVQAATSLTMAQNEGCVLVVGFEISAPQNDTSVLLYRPIEAWPFCSWNNSLQPNFTDIPNQFHIHAIYGALNSGDPGNTLEHADTLRVMAPEVIHGRMSRAWTDVNQQAFRLDGTKYYYCKNALYNITQSQHDVLPSFPKLNVVSHLRGETNNIPAVVFANNEELLKTLPNPYKPQVQASAMAGWKDPAWTVTHTLTLATATGTGLIGPTTSPLQRRRSFGRHRRS